MVREIRGNGSQISRKRKMISRIGESENLNTMYSSYTINTSNLLGLHDYNGLHSIRSRSSEDA